MTIDRAPATEAMRAEWDHVARSSDDAWVGHTWPWNRMIEEDVWQARDRSVVLSSAGRVIGIVPLHVSERRVGPLRRRILHSNRWGSAGPALVNDLGPADREAALAAAVTAMHEVARAEGADKLIVAMPPLARRTLAGPPDAANSLAAHGLLDTSNEAIVVPLAGRSEDDLWRSLTDKCRNRVRYAGRLGIVVREATRDEALEHYYPLHLETYARTGARPHPQRYFDTILRSNWSRVLLAERDGKVIAAANLLCHDGRAAYWTGASSELARNPGANNLLQWTAIRLLSEAGFAAYEVGEVPHPSVSIADNPKFHSLTHFKREFGGKTVPYHRSEHVYRTTREALVVGLRRAWKWYRR